MVVVPRGLIDACAEAVQELRASRKSLASKDILIERQDEMLMIERQISDLLKTKETLSAAEIEQLKNALAAKDRVIAASEAQIEVLKKNQMTFGKKIKYVAIGIVIGLAATAVRK